MTGPKDESRSVMGLCLVIMFRSDVVIARARAASSGVEGGIILVVIQRAGVPEQ